MEAGLAGETSLCAACCPPEVTSAPSLHPSLCPCACRTPRARLEKDLFLQAPFLLQFPPPASPDARGRAHTGCQTVSSPRLGCWEQTPNLPLSGCSIPWLFPLAWLGVPTGCELWSLFCFTLTPLQELWGSVHDWLVGWEAGNSQPCQGLSARAPSWQGSSAPQREGHGPLSAPRRVVQAQHEAGRCPQRGFCDMDMLGQWS